MTRRSFLSFLASLPFAGALFSGCRAAPSLPRLRILHMTDLHYIAPSLTDNGALFTEVIEQADGKMMLHSEQMAEAFVWQTLREKPDLVILSGDLTFNGARASHEALAQKLRRITEAGIPVYVMPGNHDLLCAWAARYEGGGYERVASVTPDEFAAIYEPFGYGQALARDEASSSYTAEPVPGLRLLFLDCNAPRAQGRLTEETLRFAERQLRAASRDGVKVLAVSHQPILPHNSLFGDSFGMGSCAPLRELYDKERVFCNLSGHMHLQHTARSEAGLTEIVCGALSVSPNQFGLLTLEHGRASYRTSILDMAGWAAESGALAADPSLADFETLSADFFRQTALRQTREELKKSGLSAEDIKTLTDFYADMNRLYFSGRMDRMVWDDELFRRWQETDAFTSIYLQSIRDEAQIDHTAVDFVF